MPSLLKTNVTTLLKTARPTFLLLTPCCLSVSLAFAIQEGVNINPVNLTLIFIGAISAHASVNMLNEYDDFKSGLDFRTQRTAFSGGSGALPASPETAETVFHYAIGCLALTALIGLYFVWSIGWNLLPLGLAGLLLVYFYSPQITRRPLLCLLVPGLGFGPVMILGSYFILTRHYSPAVLMTSLIMLCSVSNLLLLNQFPDLDSDRSAGRLHLPIWLGRKNAALVYVAFLATAYALLLVDIYVGLLPFYSLLAMLTLFAALPAAVLTLRFYDDIPRLLPALALNVIFTLSLPVLITLGLLWQSTINAALCRNFDSIC